MNLPEDTVVSMDTEFDQHLVSMKPYVVRLPHKSGNSFCAI